MKLDKEVHSCLPLKRIGKILVWTSVEQVAKENEGGNQVSQVHLKSMAVEPVYYYTTATILQPSGFCPVLPV